MKLSTILAVAGLALVANAQETSRMLTVTVGKAFVPRALIEAELDGLIRADLIDASHNVVDWKKRRRIRQLCLRLEVEQ
jgi:hypothetical protein